MTSELPVPTPERTPETAPFWDATAEHRLLLWRCDGCRRVVWYPRTLCPDCGSTWGTWAEASGLGTVYSFTVVHRGVGRYREVVPYVVAYVELEEGPRVLTNVVNCAPELVTIGLRVRVVFDDSPDGPSLYRFEPASG